MTHTYWTSNRLIAVHRYPLLKFLSQPRPSSQSGNVSIKGGSSELSINAWTRFWLTTPLVQRLQADLQVSKATLRGCRWESWMEHDEAKKESGFLWSFVFVFENLHIVPLKTLISTSVAYAPIANKLAWLGSQAFCWAMSLRGSFFYLNLEGLLSLGLQTTEALLDSGSKVTQKPASTLHLSKEDGAEEGKKYSLGNRALWLLCSLPDISSGSFWHPASFSCSAMETLRSLFMSSHHYNPNSSIPAKDLYFISKIM